MNSAYEMRCQKPTFAYENYTEVGVGSQGGWRPITWHTPLNRISGKRASLSTRHKTLTPEPQNPRLTFTRVHAWVLAFAFRAPNPTFGSAPVSSKGGPVFSW